MTDEQDALVFVSEPMLNLRHETAEEAAAPVMAIVHVFALAGRIPDGRPRLVNVGEVGALHGCEGGAWVQAGSRLHGGVPLR